MQWYGGIDNGFTGAVAFVNSDGTEAVVHDAPLFMVPTGKRKRQEFNVAAMVGILQIPPNVGTLICVAVEKAGTMPQQGISSSGRFMHGHGLWMGILAALKIPHQIVSPQRWKQVTLDGMGKDKDASRMRAQQLFPHIDLSLKKHHGRADALLIAEWLRRQCIKNVLIETKGG